MALAPFAAPVLLSAILSMPLGFVWFGPLFGKQWMKLTGVRPEQHARQQSAMPFVVSFLTALMIAVTMTLLLQVFSIANLAESMMLGFLVWATFNFLPGLTHHLFDGRPMTLLLINSGYELANTMIAAILLSWWI